MATTFARIIKYGFQNFSRNGWLSVATVVVMVLALIMLHGMIIFKHMTNTAVTAVQDKIDISVYFKAGTAEDAVLAAQRSLESMTEVKSVEYISPEQALAAFKEKHNGNETIAAALNELGGNPLLASINVKAKDANDYGKIASYFEAGEMAAIAEKVTYTQNQIVIDRLARIIDLVENAGLALVIILSLVAGLVTFNTIRLGIYSNREELGIMRLVGATNKFIRGPYVVNGVLYGIIAAAVSILIAMPTISIISPYAEVFLPELSLSAYFYSHFPQLFGYQLLFGIVLGAASATVAVRRYLKI